MLIGFSATLLAGILVLALTSFGVGIATGPRVLAGVSVAGIDLGGLDRAAAAERLEAELPSLGVGQAIVAVDGDESAVSFADLGRGYELERMVDSAYAIGRAENSFTDAVARLRSLAVTTSLPPLVHPYDPDALAALSQHAARTLSEYPVEAAVMRDGTSFQVREGQPGRVVDADDVRAALAAAVDTPRPGDVRVELSASVVAPIVSTEMATAAAEAARQAVGDLELTIPGADENEEPIGLDAETVARWMTFGPQASDPYALRFDAAAISDAVAGLAEEVDRDAHNARFGVAGSGLGGIIPGQSGRELNVAESTDGILSALASRAGGTPTPSLALAVDVTEPEFTTADAEETLPKMQMVSSWTTYYVPGDGNGYGNNISIPAWDLDGYNLAPGEWFSFWGGIGPVTVDRGYRYGGAIINGRSVAQGALAGGICSTSTTLFNAAMRFGLEIGERTAHYYYIDRYPTGLDATVAIVDDSVVDMTFRNDTENPIVIRGFGTPGQVTFQIWSVPNGRTVALSDPYITNRRTAIETTQVSSSLAPGSARRVEYPHNGFDATVSRTVYDADGNVLHENTWFSPYRAVNGITLVGPTPAAAPPAQDEGETAAEGPGGAGDAPAPPPAEGA